jgi:rhamnose utilization protein RhaD (predicted bifunctional aldolase and dehydrogenase)
MRKSVSLASHAELKQLLQLTARVGRDPLLTQASTGNSSMKIGSDLWIKASGKRMADAIHEDIFTPLDLPQVIGECLPKNVDPADRYPGVSIETAMHAVLPHRTVLHVHCVNTIAWAVRNDAAVQLQHQLEGLPWMWISYVASGLPLSKEIETALSVQPNTDLFVLGNHGLVIGGQDCDAVERLLNEVQQRLAVYPRRAPPADCAALAEICQGSPWGLPDDDEVHALGTDTTAQAVLSGGLLYPCQAIFSESHTPELFRPIPSPDLKDRWQNRYRNWPFLIIQGRGVVLGKTMSPAELAMISGLAQIVQRIDASASLRYLTQVEVATLRQHGRAVLSGYRR